MYEHDLEEKLNGFKELLLDDDFNYVFAENVSSLLGSFANVEGRNNDATVNALIEMIMELEL